MKSTQKQASARLFKKLSALRATLSNEERAILDNLVGANEVQAHKINTKINSKAEGKTNPKVSEVQAHKINTKINTKINNKAAGKAAGKTTLRIAFDPNSEEYKIQE
jgi:hypothetical protein